MYMNMDENCVVMCGILCWLNWYVRLLL